MSRYRFLFEQLVRRELRQKYKGSALGVLWYLVNPIVLMGAYTLMFGLVLKGQQIADYPIFLMIGLVAWTFFQQSLLAATPSLIDQSGLVRKARFPRQAIPASSVTVQLITFLAVFALLLPVALAVRGRVELSLLLLPVVIALLFLFALGCALACSVLHAYFRDVLPILSAALLPWFFLTPIFFRPQTIGFVERHHAVGTLLAWVNPMAPFIQSLQAVVYDGRGPGLGRLLYMVLVGAAALGAGGAIFRRFQGDLAVVV